MPTINLRGQLMNLSLPQVMGILNVTPDSFFPDSRAKDAEDVLRRAKKMVAEGATILDIGGCSTRPGSKAPSEEEEWQRLFPGLEAVRKALPEVPLSVDTFRAVVARRCVLEFGVEIINDISGGDADHAMFETIAELGVAYVLTHNDSALSLHPDLSPEEVLSSVARYLAGRIQRLQELGVADIILDPGYGFGKTLQQNYALVHSLPDLIRCFDTYPILIGFSRKSMIYHLLDSAPEEALTGTVALNTLALQAGAHILRVHDVREAVETVKVWKATQIGIHH